MPFDVAPPPNFDQVWNSIDVPMAVERPLASYEKEKEAADRARQAALREAAIGYGARTALARRSWEVETVLDGNQAAMDRIYNIRQLVLDSNVLPPVLVEARASVSVTDADTIRVADAVYRIEKQAQFVTQAPTWRDYLSQRLYVTSPEQPDPFLLPANPAEKQIWAGGINEGWQIGIKQADDMFDNDLARLEHDYLGMILYRRLLSQGRVSLPYVAESNLGVTGDGSSVSINDRVLRITSKPALGMDVNSWKTLIAPARKPGVTR